MTRMNVSGKTITRVVVVVAVVVALSLFAAFVYDATVTNALIAKLTVHQPGTPFAEVEAQHGPPDRVEEVAGSWKWGRRMRSVPDHVTHIATYYKATMPQICAFLLDKDGMIVEVDVFAGY